MSHLYLEINILYINPWIAILADRPQEFLLTIGLICGRWGGGEEEGDEHGGKRRSSPSSGIRLTVTCDACCLESGSQSGTVQSHSTGPDAALLLELQPGMNRLSLH